MWLCFQSLEFGKCGGNIQIHGAEACGVFGKGF